MRHSIVLVLLLVAVGCGGGGDDEIVIPEATNVSGWWQITMKYPSDVDWMEGPLLQLEDTGALIYMQGFELTRTGDTITMGFPTRTDPDRSTYVLTVRSANLIEGTIDQYNAGVLQDQSLLRFERGAAPTGTFTITGLLQGQPIDHACTMAQAYDEAGATPQLEVHVVDAAARGTFTLHVMDSGGESLAVRTYSIGTTAGTVRLSLDESPWENRWNALSGTVTFTVLTADRVEGTYDVVLTEGGGISGSFAADITRHL